MPIGSLSRKRVWTGEASDAADVDDNSGALATSTTTADRDTFTQPRKHVKRVHTLQLPTPHSWSDPPIAQHSQPHHSHATAQPPQHSSSSPASHSYAASLSDHPTSPPHPTSLSPLPAAGVHSRLKRKRASAELRLSDDRYESGTEEAVREESNKRHNGHLSFTFPPLPPSPLSLPNPAPFTYSDHISRLSDNNLLLQSLHAARVSRRQQQQSAPQQHVPAAQRLDERTDWRAAGAISRSIRQQSPAAGESDYCMLPLYGGRQDMFDSDSSWASSISDSSNSSHHSPLHAHPQSVPSWSSASRHSASTFVSLYSAPFASVPSSSAATSMSVDATGSARLHRTNSNESMREQ